MHKSLQTLALVGVVAFATPALAQVNTVPSSGLTTGYLARTTYSAAFIGLVPAAATTDLICMAGAAGKQIRLQNIRLSGSGTAISIPVTLVRRTAVNTGGTLATTTANPGNTISKRDTASPTASANLGAWTANPTIVDTSPTYIDSQQMSVAATSAAANPPTVFDFSKDVENFLQPPVLKSAAEIICVNLNATSATALLTGTLTWTEE